MNKKPYNFKWSIEAIKEEAKKYRYRTEFYRNSMGAYSAAKKYKILDEVCAHMIYMSRMSMEQSALSDYVEFLGFEIKKNFKVRGVEYDIFIPSINKAIEYDGKYWHKKEQDTTKDIKSKENGVSLLRVCENDWKSEYRENCFKNICIFLNIEYKIEKRFLEKYVKSKIQVGFSNDELFEIAKQFDNKRDLLNHRPDIYKRLRRRGLIDEACTHMNHLRKKSWNLEEAIEESKKYKTSVEFQKNASRAYMLCYKAGLTKRMFKDRKKSTI